MSVVAAAIVTTTAYSASQSRRASNTQANSAREGIAAEERITERNLELQRELSEQQRQDFEPWRVAGQDALRRIREGIDAGDFVVPDDFDYKTDPGYEFRLNQGIEARDKSAAARGLLLSGAQQKELEDYGQGMASQEYANAYAREFNKRKTNYNILNSLNVGGQSSAARQAQSTGQLATTTNNALTNLGRGTNIAHQNVGNARASGYQNQATAVNQGVSNWLTYKLAG